MSPFPFYSIVLFFLLCPFIKTTTIQSPAALSTIICKSNSIQPNAKNTREWSLQFEGVEFTVSTGCFQVRPHFFPKLRSGLICLSYILIMSTIILVIFSMALLGFVFSLVLLLGCSNLHCNDLFFINCGYGCYIYTISIYYNI